MPISKDNADMPKWGWKQSLLYEKIKCDDSTRGRPILTELDYYANKQICGKCRSNEYTWVLVPSYHYTTGVFVSCNRCGITWGPVGDRAASNKRTREISIEEAIEVCLRTQQGVPVALRDRLKEIKAEQARAAQGLPARPKKIGE